MKPFRLSVIIPVYNEENRINNLPKVDKYFRERIGKYELIVIDDGSTDKTLDFLNKFKSDIDFKILTYPVNRGKGYAVKTGMLHASGDYRLFLDIDLSTSPEEFEKFESFLNDADILIGTRKSNKRSLIKRQPFLREFMGKGFTLLSKLILNVKTTDFTCGFKIFSANAADQIFSKVTIERWGFDSEALFLAKKLHFKVMEISVDWKNDPRTRVRFPQDVIRSFLDLLKIISNNLIGVYN